MDVWDFLPECSFNSTVLKQIGCNFHLPLFLLISAWSSSNLCSNVIDFEETKTSATLSTIWSDPARPTDLTEYFKIAKRIRTSILIGSISWGIGYADRTRVGARVSYYRDSGTGDTNVQTQVFIWVLKSNIYSTSEFDFIKKKTFSSNLIERIMDWLYAIALNR